MLGKLFSPVPQKCLEGLQVARQTVELSSRRPGTLVKSTTLQCLVSPCPSPVQELLQGLLPRENTLSRPNKKNNVFSRCCDLISTKVRRAMRHMRLRTSVSTYSENGTTIVFSTFRWGPHLPSAPVHTKPKPPSSPLPTERLRLRGHCRQKDHPTPFFFCNNRPNNVSRDAPGGNLDKAFRRAHA